jgi:hypothetical protein
MRLVTGRAFRKYVLLKGIEAEAEDPKRMELGSRGGSENVVESAQGRAPKHCQHAGGCVRH